MRLGWVSGDFRRSGFDAAVARDVSLRACASTLLCFVAPRARACYHRVGTSLRSLPRSDVFSAGVLLYYMIDATLPFYGRDIPATLRKTVKGKFWLGSSFDVVADMGKAPIARLTSCVGRAHLGMHVAEDLVSFTVSWRQIAGSLQGFAQGRLSAWLRRFLGDPGHDR